MAGARQGWIEAPYAETPATLGDVLAGAISVPGIDRDVRIIPGIAQKDIDMPDVLRGEETQLAGITALRGAGSHLVCMPGTHSKWVAVKDGVVTGFGTWMTGELYSVIAKESVLKHSVGGGSLAFSPKSEAYAKAVRQGLDDSASLTSRLFRHPRRQPAAQALIGRRGGNLVGLADWRGDCRRADALRRAGHDGRAGWIRTDVRSLRGRP